MLRVEENAEFLKNITNVLESSIIKLLIAFIDWKVRKKRFFNELATVLIAYMNSHTIKTI